MPTVDPIEEEKIRRLKNKTIGLAWAFTVLGISILIAVWAEVMGYTQLIDSILP